MYPGHKILLKGGDRSSAPRKRVAVIGCGMAGLVSLKTALEDGHDAIGFERQSDIGGLWNYKMYGGDEPYAVIVDPEEYSFPGHKGLVTNTSRYTTMFSDFEPLKPEGGDEFSFMSADELCAYAKAYAANFRLEPHMRFNAHVFKIEKQDKKWHVSYKTENETKTEIVDNVLVTTGGFGYPRFPEIEGSDNFKGVLIHSGQVRNGGSLFRDKRILIIGASISGCEIMTIALENGARKIYVCSTKRPETTCVWSFEHYTKSVYGDFRPWDYQLSRDTGLETPDFGYLFANWCYPYHKPKPDTSFTYPGDVIAVSSVGSILKAEQDGLLEFIKPVTRYSENGVVSANGEELNDIDVIICATGYDAKFPFLDQVCKREEQISGKLYNYVISPNPALDGIAFALTQPGSWALVGVGEMQARWFFHKIVPREYNEDDTIFSEAERQHMRDTLATKTAQLPPTFPFNFIDNIPLVSETLAIDMGAEPPDYKELIESGDEAKIELGVALLYGPLIPPQYRIQGPHAWPPAARVCVALAKRFLGKHFDEFVASVKNNIYPRSGKMDPSNGPWNDYTVEKVYM